MFILLNSYLKRNNNFWKIYWFYSFKKQVEHIIKQIFEINKYWDLKLKYLTSKIFVKVCISLHLLVCNFCNLHTCCSEFLWADLLLCTSLLYSASCSFCFQLLVSSIFGFQGCLICICFHLLSINRNKNPIHMQSLQSRPYWSNMANLILHYKVCVYQWNTI